MKALVIGACALDRLLHVTKYPNEDEKMLCQSSYEFGGGNAANTASGLGRMSNAKAITTITTKDDDRSYTVQLLTKVADDEVKEKICKELVHFDVDLSSDLFVKGPKGSKSPIATVIVSQNEASHSTRTCFFDKGTCGVLDRCDVEKMSIHNMDKTFENVVLLHSDSRHTEAAIILAREARKRNIPVSLDIEKDRDTRSFDDLIDLAAIVFTSGCHLKKVIDRRIGSDITFSEKDVDLIFEDEECYENIQSIKDGTLKQSDFWHLLGTMWTVYHMMKLRGNFTENDFEVIVTRGHLGAHSCKVKHYSSSTAVAKSNMNKVKIQLRDKDGVGKISIYQKLSSSQHQHESVVRVETVEYEIYEVGPPYLESIIDTTGAGDAFAAGYLWGEMILLSQRNQLKKGVEFDDRFFKLRMGSWCAGKKLSGPGARANLPTSRDIDDQLGLDINSIYRSLHSKVAD